MIELLVVIAIIALLASMLLPAVQRARELARRSTCSNNLHELYVACDEYQTAYGQYPLNWYHGNYLNNPTCATDDMLPCVAGGSWSWFVAALEYLDEPEMYQEIRRTRPIANHGSGNPLRLGMNYVGDPTLDPPSGGLIPAGGGFNLAQHRRHVIETLLCPSNHQLNTLRDQSQDEMDGSDGGLWSPQQVQAAARTDYVGNMGFVWAGWKDCQNVNGRILQPECDPNSPTNRVYCQVEWWRVPHDGGVPWISERWNNDIPGLNGLFHFRHSFGESDVIDGRQTTILCFEDMHWRGSADPFNTEYIRKEQPTELASWASPLAAIDPVTNPINMDNPIMWDPNTLGGSFEGDLRCHSWSSMHGNGAHAVMVDGSVHFVNEQIDLSTRYRLGNRMDHQTVSEFTSE